MRQMRGTWWSVLAGLLLLTGCGGCSDESTANPDPNGQSTPDTTPEPAAKPAPEPTDTPKKPPRKPKKPPVEPKKSEIETAIENLERLGAKVDRPKRADGTYEPVRGVFLANNNRNARDAIKFVANLPTIKLLHVTGGSISDADMFYLMPLKNLESLKLKDTKITSAGLAYLQDKHKLKYLNLINTKVDDSGMQFLKHMKNLRFLLVGGTKVTRKAGEALQKQIPNLKIK
ncbi:MAG: hypothetical protein MI757_08890 [Pirellulales bacterium]|nr:hypothetical protein [Pirellulales bacterium]